jgi:hypothetical protein
VAALAPPRLLSRAERLVAHTRERQIEASRVVAAVVRHAAHVLERQLVGAQEVLAAEVGGILTETAGQPVDEDFADVVRLGLPVAAIRAGGHLVGEHHAAVNLRVVETIGPGEHDARQERRSERPVVGAQVDQVAVTQGEQGALAVGPERQSVDGLARVRGAAEELRAVLDPLHRAPRVDGDEGRDDVLGGDADLEAERAPHVGSDHAHVRLVHAQAVRELGPQEVRRLRGGPQLERVGVLHPARDHPPRLDRRPAHPVDAERALHGHGGVGQPSVRLASPHRRLHDDVAGNGGMELRRPRGERVLDAHGVRQRFVVDVDQLERVLGHVAVHRGHRDDDLTLVAGDLARHAVEHGRR